MGSTAAIDTGKLLHRVGTAVDRGLGESFEDSIKAAKVEMDRPYKYSVTSRRSRQTFKPKAIAKRGNTGVVQVARMKYVPAAPAYWTEFGTKPHWIYPHGKGRASAAFVSSRNAEGIRKGRASGSKALLLGPGDFKSNAFVSGVRPKPFFKRMRPVALDKAMDKTRIRTLENILVAGFGR